MTHISMDIVYVVIGIRAKQLIQNKIMVHKTVQALYKMKKKKKTLQVLMTQEASTQRKLFYY